MRRRGERARSVALSLALALALGAPCAWPGVARAGDGERDAASLFEEGASAYARGEFRAAALAFEEAYRRAPRGATMYDAAVAWEQAKTWDRAADDFAAAIADPALDAKHVVDARRRLAGAEKHVGLVEVSAPSGALVTVGPLEAARAPARVHLRPGNYEVNVRFASGATAAREVLVEAGATARAAFDADPGAPPASAPSAPSASASAPSAPSASAPPASAPSASASAAPESAASSGPPFAALGWIGVGVAAAGALGAGLLWSQALSARDQFDAGGEQDAALHDRAASLRTATNVVWAATAVVAVGALVLLVVAQAQRHDAPRAAAR